MLSVRPKLVLVKQPLSGLPTPDKIRTEENTIQALVIAPTRELACTCTKKSFSVLVVTKALKFAQSTVVSALKTNQGLRSGAHIVVTGRLL